MEVRAIAHEFGSLVHQQTGSITARCAGAEPVRSLSPGSAWPFLPCRVALGRTSMSREARNSRSSPPPHRFPPVRTVVLRMAMPLAPTASAIAAAPDVVG